jgi:putative transposase
MDCLFETSGTHRLRTGRATLRSCVYFITTATAKRRKLFYDHATAAIAAHSLQYFHDRNYVHGYAWVVMPDHIHWLVQLRSGTIENLMRRFKTWTSYRIRRSVQASSIQTWQRGFHDRRVRHHENLQTYINYLVLNPVRWGLVTHPRDYPFLYAEHELLEVYGAEPKPFT